MNFTIWDLGTKFLEPKFCFVTENRTCPPNDYETVVRFGGAARAGCEPSPVRWRRPLSAAVPSPESPGGTAAGCLNCSATSLFAVACCLLLAAADAFIIPRCLDLANVFPPLPAALSPVVQVLLRGGCYKNCSAARLVVACCLMLLTPPLSRIALLSPPCFPPLPAEPSLAAAPMSDSLPLKVF